MKAIALDDERPALDVIDAFCNRIDSVELVKTFTRPGEARLYLETNPIDLLYLDINMPKESGISFYRSISQQPLVIFTTAYSEFAAESYELEAVDYLLKPFTFNRFGQALQRAQSRLQLIRQTTLNPPDDAEQAYLYFRVDFNLVKVTVADILFVKGLDNYLKIYLGDGRSLVVRLTLKAMLDKLPAKKFIRVHRSYIVAFDKIHATRNRMILIGEEEIPLGSNFEKDFFSRFIR